MVGIRNVQTEFLTEEYLCVKKEMPIVELELLHRKNGNPCGS